MSELVERAREIASELSSRSAEIEAARRLPADLADEFRAAGFFHALVPREYGGTECHPGDLCEMIETIATGDGSAGWNVMIGATTGLLAVSLPVAHAEEIYGDAPGALTVGVTAPMGKAIAVEGGHRVSGRWAFGSGCQNADWICGGCFVYEDDERVEGQFGPEIHLMLMKPDDIEIEDTWHVTGLKGTGSHHFHAEDAFVPTGRSVVLGGKSHFERPLYRFPMLGMLALGVASVSLGIGFRALDEFIDLAGGKKPTGSRRALAERALVQRSVARARADLTSARALIRETLADAWEVAARDERLDTRIRAELRLAAANATHRAVGAVDALYQSGGGTAIYEDSPLQRCLRDVHVTTQHIMVADPVFEVAGRVELGLDPKSML